MRRLFLLAENIVAFTWVDWAIIAVIAVSSLISLKRGFVKEALSLLTWIIAGVVAWMFGGALSHHLAEYISTPSAQVIAACALLFVATLLVGALVNFLIGELIRVTGLSGTDRFPRHGIRCRTRWPLDCGARRLAEPRTGGAGPVVARIGIVATLSPDRRLVEEPDSRIQRAMVRWVAQPAGLMSFVYGCSACRGIRSACNN